MVNVPKLITAARDACYPYIFEIEKQIIKSKTNSVEEVKAKKRLYISIYALAYFIRVVAGNKGEITFKNLKITSKNPVVDMVKLAIDTVMTTRNVTIREIRGMTPDVIKNTLIEAYKSLQTA
jgi:phosphoribosylformylglycinamidine (FGAM) synthase PurS component